MHGQRWREAGKLLLPIAERTDGSHNQDRLSQPTVRNFKRNMRNRLHRFPKTHVVRENAAKSELAEELQPPQPFLLILTELSAKDRRGRQRPNAGKIIEALEEGCQRGVRAG